MAFPLNDPSGVWTFRRYIRGRAFYRAEGPAVNSPAREGGELHDLESEVRRTGTPTVPHLRSSFLNLKSVPASRPGLRAFSCLHVFVVNHALHKPPSKTPSQRT